jgi:hypothetical protein
MGTSVSADSLVAVEHRTAVVRRGALLLAAEGLVLVAVGVVDAAATVTGSPANRGLSYGVAGFAVGGGVVLLLLARAIDGRRGWARSPSIVLQLLCLPVGIGFLQGGIWAAGVPVLLLALTTLWHLVTAGPALAADG